jgi:hypothetical protein
MRGSALKPVAAVIFLLALALRAVIVGTLDA